MLKLPAYQDLAREQLEIYNLPLNGSYLVVGPPGTGKTIMALHRASMYLRASMKTHFLVYSNTLTQYLDQAVKQEKLDSVATTLHKWFPYWYQRSLRRWPPRVAKFEFDWNTILSELNNYLKTGRMLNQYEHIVIDEGQDFPKEFYFVLRLITKNITVFADENQRITETQSTLREIQQSLALRPDHIHKLARNYRNTRPIAEFAAQYYAQLRSGVPELPARNGPKPRLLMARSIKQQVEFIARYERNNADKDIAIFVERTGQQEKIYEMLEADSKGTANPVQIYVSRDQARKKLDFGRPGIRILTYASAKGLEFDTVFLPLLDRSRTDLRSDMTRMRYYVLTSRARQELILMGSGEETPPMLQGIPESLYDVEALTRRRER
jgi:superfamily I DNA/RNA helicase